MSIEVTDKTADYWLKLIEDNWDNIGACQSCGWHALFHEHNIDAYDINDALKDGGDIRIFCASKDDEDSIDHRGARFNLYHLKHNNERTS